jgi:hypothetical protein
LDKKKVIDGMPAKQAQGPKFKPQYHQKKKKKKRTVLSFSKTCQVKKKKTKPFTTEYVPLYLDEVLEHSTREEVTCLGKDGLRRYEETI